MNYVSARRSASSVRQALCRASVTPTAWCNDKEARLFAGVAAFVSGRFRFDGSFTGEGAVERIDLALQTRTENGLGWLPLIEKCVFGFESGEELARTLLD